MNGVYRTNSSHGDTAKKWFDICKNCAINRLHNQTGTNANLIFVAKAAYGMAETAPVQVAQQYGVPQQTAQQIAEKHKSRFAASGDGKAGAIARKTISCSLAIVHTIYSM